MSQSKLAVFFIMLLLFLTSCSHYSKNAKVSNQHTHKGNRCSKSVTHDHLFRTTMIIVMQPRQNIVLRVLHQAL